MKIFTKLIALLLMFTIYFFPFGVALYRQTPGTKKVFVCNLFLGWTFIGWVIALIWAVED